MVREGFPTPHPSFNPLKYSGKWNPNATVKTPAKASSSASEEPKKESVVVVNTQTKVETEAILQTPDMDSIPTKSTTTIGSSVFDQANPGEKQTPKSSNNPHPEANSSETKIQTSNVEQTEPSETLRLVSLREIKQIHQTKIGNRWFTLADLDGWVCLVPRRAFKPLDLVVYVEIDSFLPASDERFGKHDSLITYEGKLGHRVKTRRFGSGDETLVVQGLVYPLERFPEIDSAVTVVREVMGIMKPTQEVANSIILAIYRNENWAEKLGVTKWEEAKQVGTQPQQQHVKVGKIPTHLFPKTDISRLEDCPNFFKKAKYLEREYQESVKMDGTSMTVYFVNKKSQLFRHLNPLPENVGPNMELKNGRFGVCSKNIELNELNKGDQEYWQTALRHDLPAKLSKLGRNIAIQGELCGPNINQNREKIQGGQNEFFVFAMYHMDTKKYIHPHKVVTMAEELGLKHVEVLGYVKIPEIAKNGEGLKKRASQREGEGLVYKCIQDGRSFKVISSTYLLEHNL